MGTPSALFIYLFFLKLYFSPSAAQGVFDASISSNEFHLVDAQGGGWQESLHACKTAL